MADMQAVLDQMTAGITATKQAASAGLTPVGTEKGGPLGGAATGAPFPFDRTDMMVQALDNIDREVAWLREALGAVKAVAPKPEDEKRARERAADAARAADAPTNEFEERIADLSARAQAATFTDVDAPAPASGNAWECPKHGTATLLLSKSRRGRDYYKCTTANCGRFQKPEEVSS